MAARRALAWCSVSLTRSRTASRGIAGLLAQRAQQGLGLLDDAIELFDGRIDGCLEFRLVGGGVHDGSLIYALQDDPPARASHSDLLAHGK